MQSEIESIKRLKDPKKVSSHYLINRKGEITKMVSERKTVACRKIKMEKLY